MLTDISPFRIHDNIYFVGSSRVSVHLLDTELGLILIDSGYPDMFEQITESIKCLGFDPKDVSVIFHSHGHIDHFGCTPQFKNLSGARTYISRIDNEIINGTRELSWAVELGYTPLTPFDCDTLIEDGDVFTFGKTSIRCVLTAGHTDGVMSFFINNGDITAAMHGGVGLNSMTADYLNANNLSFECREVFRKGLHSLATEKVDLVLGNHPEQNDTQGKLKTIQKGGIVTDPGEWMRFLKKTESELDELILLEGIGNA